MTKNIKRILLLVLIYSAILAGTIILIVVLVLDKNTSPKDNENTLSDIFKTSSSVMWIGPHPDDELFVAGTLGYLCKDLDYNCTIVAIGENPDFIEANKQSSQFLNAEYIRLADRIGKIRLDCHYKKNSKENIDCIAESWIAGGIEQEITKILSEKKPDIVFTFEPESTIELSQTHAASSIVVKKAIDDSKVSVHHYYVIQTTLLTEESFDKDKSGATDVFDLDTNLWNYKMQVVSFYSFHYPSLEKLVNNKTYQQERIHQEIFRKVI
ncbi:MAG: PIG-L family deacetylase [Patescibacteria group bacterium]|nr:PIG-L family deacetylase [Patescibacteria group bacterium]